MNVQVIDIKEGALLIADSHYPHHGDAFMALLKKLDKGEVKTSQLFLMGDNFDLLFGHNDYVQQFSQNAIVLLQKISKTLEVHYLEGNHDFCLKDIFPDIKVYSREYQPVACKLGDKRVAMSHGDKYVTGFFYDVFSKVLRSKITLRLLKPLQKMLINHGLKKLPKKDICKPFVQFEVHVSKILSFYQEVDLVIEGHFHQSKKIGKYISLPSLACQGLVAQVEGDNIVFKKL